MLDTKKKLSVVMPAYNEGEHIYDNLKKVANVLSGLMTDYEILAVNDGSKDNTKKEIVRYAKENPCVQEIVHLQVLMHLLHLEYIHVEYLLDR